MNSFEKIESLWENCVRMTGVMVKTAPRHPATTETDRAQDEKGWTDIRKREENDEWNIKNRAIWGMSIYITYLLSFAMMMHGGIHLFTHMLAL